MVRLSIYSLLSKETGKLEKLKLFSAMNVIITAFTEKKQEEVLFQYWDHF